MTSRILSMGFAMMATVGLLGGCGGIESPTTQDSFVCPISYNTDRDGDGVLGDDVVAWGSKEAEENDRRLCGYPDDWCPNHAGRSENHGCPTVQENDSCSSGQIGDWLHDFALDAPNPQEVYPKNLYCLIDPQADLQVLHRLDKGPYTGQWVSPPPGLALYAVTNTYSALTWKKKDGSSGTSFLLKENNFDLPLLVLPHDGSLASIEIETPNARLSYYKFDSSGALVEIKCTDRNASGGAICHF